MPPLLNNPFGTLQYLFYLKTFQVFHSTSFWSCEYYVHNLYPDIIHILAPPLLGS